MSARRFKGHRVGVIKPDGARRYMKPRADGKWSLVEAKPMLLDEDEMSDALDEVGVFMFADDVSFSTPVFATRKPKPAPAEGAAEGRYAVLRKNWGGNEFRDLHYGDDTRSLCHVGTRATVDESQRRVGPSKDAEVVRILADGAFEAAVEAARREERARICALLQATRDDAKTAPQVKVGVTYARAVIKADEAHEAAKGQAK